MILLLVVWIAAGSALGGVLRFLIAGFVTRTAGSRFPWGTLMVNATGCLAIGVLAAAAGAGALDGWSHGHAAVATGLLGSYTTVSSFSLETLGLARDGQWRRAGGNVLLSLALCLCAVAAGFLAGTALLGQAA